MTWGRYRGSRRTRGARPRHTRCPKNAENLYQTYNRNQMRCSSFERIQFDRFWYVCFRFYGVMDVPKGRQPSGLEEVPVVLHGASPIVFLELISFVCGRGGPKYYVTAISSSLGNFFTSDNLILLQRNPKQKFPIFWNSPFPNTLRTTKGWSDGKML